MNRRDMLLASGLAALGATHFPFAWSSAEGKRRQRKLLFFTKSASFEHSSIRREGDQLSHAERVLTELGKQHGFEVICTKDGRVFDSDLEQYDAFMFYTTGDLTTAGKDGQPPMTAVGKKRLIDAVAGGKGFLASHCGSDTFHSPGERFEEQNPEDQDPYIAMLGGEFIKHGPQQEARQVVVSTDFPGMQGIESFSMHEEWYSLKNFAGDLQVLLVQDTQGMKGPEYQRPPYPATWARQHGKGRVFYTSMGHREDVWDHATFQQILLGGIAWATGKAKAELKPNVAEVAPGAHVMPPKVEPKQPAQQPKKKKVSQEPAAAPNE